ncbi:hypothetical protein FA95DRAFT_1011868 [Auriscalpium vulgare]|uniref:Uncharacterized protein n=1 Tax=Auriscalpium vulgare TaxID=40419 RepID=A0ACB8RYT8_9AGAM|nr:hypothetical protein FA95DRAFT_1011868 [Auriscalpium vulgare]
MPVLATDSSTQLSSSAIYRSASPIFDVPEFPPLRRVKPLPKRRRSSLDSLPPLPPVLPPTPGPDASADELIAHAEALSAHMTLQAYYLPTLAALDGVPPIDRDRREDNDRDADGDYFDHLQQPGNAKKRKVPAHLSGGGAAQAGAEEPPDGLDGADEELAERKHGDAPGVGRQDHDADVGVAAPSAVAGRGRMLPATLVGLQHKEMLRHRKRQLAAVLGALSHGDTLALDQALSAHYPILNNASNTSRSRARYARRRRPRLPVRTQRAAAAFPGGEFSFVCHSASECRALPFVRARV